MRFYSPIEDRKAFAKSVPWMREYLCSELPSLGEATAFAVRYLWARVVGFPMPLIHGPKTDHEYDLWRDLQSRFVVPPSFDRSDDGWTWFLQFWREEEKAVVNRGGGKVGSAAEVGAVTQLFTEPYMAEFLLHNTIGSWWCDRHGVKGHPGGAGLPNGVAPVDLPFLRFRDDGSPAAGGFPGWPDRAADIKIMDPCVGGGMFLIVALHLLVPMRMQEEGIDCYTACCAVLRDNLFALDIDPVCVELAKMNLLFNAAKEYPSAPSVFGDEWPDPNIACIGGEVHGTRQDWIDLLLGGGELWDMATTAKYVGSLLRVP